MRIRLFRLFRAVRVEYAFGTDGEIYGTTVVGDSPYKPYGVRTNPEV